MRKMKVFSILTTCLLALTIGLTSCASAPASGGGSGSGGTLTITDIPSEFNDSKIYFQVFPDSNSASRVFLAGLQSINGPKGTSSIVSNGRARLPMWIHDETSDSFLRYNGNDVFTQSDSVTIQANIDRFDGFEELRIIYTYLTITFHSVRFSNGNATLSYKDGIVERQ